MSFSETVKIYINDNRLIEMKLSPENLKMFETIVWNFVEDPNWHKW